MSVQPAEEGQHPPVKANRNYLLFIILTAVAVFSVGRLTIFIPLLESVTTKLTLSLASLVGVSASYKNTLLTVDGFRMSFIAECTALHFIILFSLAIFFTPKQKTRHRVAGIMAGIPTIILMNAVRLVLLGLIGSRTTRHSFDIIHDFIFQILMAILMLAMWFFWSEQKFANAKKINLSIAVIVFSAFYLFLASAVGGTYLAIMAYATSKIFSSVGFVDIAAAMREGRFSYLIKWKLYSINYRQDAISLALLWGLFSASIWQEITAQANNLKPLLKWVAAGTVIIMALQLAECVAVGVFLRQGVRAASVVEYLHYPRLLFIGVPIVMWCYSEKLFQRRRPLAVVPTANGVE